MKHRELRDADRSSLLHPFTSIADHQRDGAFVVSKAQGVYLEDMDGNRHLDGAAGLWCVNIGHGREEITRAIAEQAAKVAFTHSFTGFANEPSVRLAERLLGLAPPGMARVFFGLTGSDANETNIKLAWYYNNLRGKPRKKKIIARHRGYHGSTFLAGALTGQENVHRNFDLDFPLIRRVSAPDYGQSAERRAGLSEAQYVDALVDELVQLIEIEGADTIAAMIAEPVMGVAGVLPPPRGLLRRMQEVLRHHDILYLSDEVIAAFGRLGTWFGTEPFDAVPDMITVAKGLSSAYLPISGSIISEGIWDVLQRESPRSGALGHGFTYSAHPLCSAAAMANLDVLEREQLLPRVQTLAPVLADAFRRHFTAHPLVSEARACGLLAAIELADDKEARRPFPAGRKIGPRVAKAAANRGVIVRALAPGDVIACSPAFIIEPAEIERLAGTLREALDEVAAEIVRDA
jgi:L-2,4-diaminobutyrate transaminase